MGEASQPLVDTCGLAGEIEQSTVLAPPTMVALPTVCTHEKEAQRLLQRTHRHTHFDLFSGQNHTTPSSYPGSTAAAAAGPPPNPCKCIWPC